ncbi:TonB-dependent siderophore receptor [Ursidibacter arcticus]
MKLSFKYNGLMLALCSFYANAETSSSSQLEQINVDSKIDSYSVPGTFSSTGLPTTLRQFPQSISVITEKQINDQNINSVDQVLLRSTGVSQQIWGSNRAGYNHLYARGYQISNYQLDGIPISDAFNDTANLSTAFYDRVEVVRGVSALLDGSGEPSATVNLVRKRPLSNPQTQLKLGMGSWNYYNAVLDSSYQGNSIGGRTVIIADTQKTWRDREKAQDIGIYSIFEYNISPLATFSLGGSFQQNKETASASHSIVTYDSEGYLTHFSPKVNPAPQWAYSKVKTINLFSTFTYAFTPKWLIKTDYSYTKRIWDHPYGVAGVLGIQHSGGSTDMITGYWRSSPSTHSLSSTLSGEYEFAGRSHNVVLGINGYRYDNTKAFGERNLGKLANIYDLDSITNYLKPNNYMQKLPRSSAKSQIGGYIANQFSINSYLNWTIGGRYNYYKDKSFNRSTQNMIVVRNRKFTPYTGIVLNLSDNISAYLSYSQLFVPQSQKDQNGQYLKPSSGYNIEAGIKGEWLNGLLNTSFSVFNARKKHLAVVAGKHSDGEAYYKAIDSTRIQGWEAEIAGKIKDNWFIQASFSQTLARDSKRQRVNTESVPHSMFKLFTTYNVTPNWTIGGGIRWQSETYLNNITGRFSEQAKSRAISNARQKNYTIVDVMTRYQVNKNIELNLHINNIFNTKYRTQPDRHSYGELRNIKANITYRF